MTYGFETRLKMAEQIKYKVRHDVINLISLLSINGCMFWM